MISRSEEKAVLRPHEGVKLNMHGLFVCHVPCPPILPPQHLPRSLYFPRGFCQFEVGSRLLCQEEVCAGPEVWENAGKC